MGGGPGYRSVAYFVNWAIYARKHRPQDLPLNRLTHILYAFANVKPNGTVHLTDPWSDTDIHWADSGDSWNDVGTNLYGCLKQLNLLKRRNRNLKLLLSIGGWTYSSNFPAPASTEAGRKEFAHSAVEILKTVGLDGIDIDWEYPNTPAQGQDYVLLLKAVRQALDVYSSTVPGNPHFSLTVASPAGGNNLANMDLQGMDPLLDFWNLMAYDFAGSWDKLSGHQSNLHKSACLPCCTPFDCDSTLSAYASAGVPMSKIVLGMPLYGRAFENTDGPGTPFSGVGQGTWENGVFDYKALPLPGSAVVEDDGDCGASYCFDSSKKKMVSYDTEAMAGKKAEFIRAKGLGGGMWWESSADKGDGEGSLIKKVVDGFGGENALLREENCITYPHTKYDNLKAGFPNDKC